MSTAHQSRLSGWCGDSSPPLSEDDDIAQQQTPDSFQRQTLQREADEEDAAVALWEAEQAQSTYRVSLATNQPPVVHVHHHHHHHSPPISPRKAALGDRYGVSGTVADEDPSDECEDTSPQLSALRQQLQEEEAKRDLAEQARLNMRERHLLEKQRIRAHRMEQEQRRLPDLGVCAMMLLRPGAAAEATQTGRQAAQTGNHWLSSQKGAQAAAVETAHAQVPLEVARAVVPATGVHGEVAEAAQAAAAAQKAATKATEAVATARQAVVVAASTEDIEEVVAAQKVTEKAAAAAVEAAAAAVKAAEVAAAAETGFEAADAAQKAVEEAAAAQLGRPRHQQQHRRRQI